MRYLHLSDIHFTPSRDGLLSQRIREGLLAYLVDNNIKADDIFFCGDLRNAVLNPNDPNAAKIAVDYLRGIAAAVGNGEPARIHMAPGNHDLDRGDVERVKEIRDSYSPSNGNFGKDEGFLLDRFSFFREAVGLLDAADGQPWRVNPMPLHTYDDTLDDYNVLYINTAVTCCETTERGHLVVGTEKIDGILAKLRRDHPSKPIIALGHHDLNCLHKKEHEALESLFRQYGVLLYLTGDAHDAWMHTASGTIEMTSGCIMDGKVTDPVFFVGEIAEGKIKMVAAHHWVTVGTIEGKWLQHEAFNDKIGTYVKPAIKPVTKPDPLHNLSPRNPNFTGREGELRQIREALTQVGSASLTQTIAGLGGVGKTQTALAYARRHLSAYADGVCWLNAERADSLLNSAFAFAQKAGYPGEAVPETLQPWLRHWFSNRENYLIIFDNAGQETDIGPYMPDPQRGHALITTRNRGAKYGAVIDLDPLKLEEAVELLCARTQRKKMRGDKAVAELAERLGRLPLALEQAAAYMWENGTPFAEYAEMLNREGLLPLREKDTKPPNYHAIVTTTWTVSINKLEDPAAKELLNLCAYFDADQIPLGVLAAYRDNLPEELRGAFGAISRKNKLIKELRRYSLVTRDEETGDISIHRLVQEVVRETLRGAGDLAFLDAAFGVMWDAMPTEYGADPAVYDLFKRVAMHAFAVAGYYAEAYAGEADKQKQARVLFFWVGRGYRDVTVQYDLALSAYEKCAAICEKVFGKDHKDTAATYNEIALVYNDKGDYDTALVWYHRSLAIKEKALGTDHPETAATYSNIGSAYHGKAKNDKALEWYHKALAIYEKAFGKDHLGTSSMYGNIGSTHNSNRDYDVALKWLYKDMSVREKLLGKDHPSTATTYNNIAFAYNGKKDRNKALEWYRKALVIKEKVLGTDHLSTATTYHGIGIVYYHKGEPGTALDWLYKALFIWEKKLGKNHPSTITTQDSINAIQRQLAKKPD